jgi:hypothetical protein
MYNQESQGENRHTNLEDPPETSHLADRGHGQQRDYDGQLIGIDDQIASAGGAERSPAMVGRATLAIEPSSTEIVSANQIVAAAQYRCGSRQSVSFHHFRYMREPRSAT